MTCTDWEIIIARVPQGSILGPILLNISLFFLLYREKFDQCNHVEDCTLYTANKFLDTANKLASARQKLLW